ncbi:MAG TPA: fibronectin type III domain-containing protein [Candidatus Peribacterales bacterium]|nr:fibronectin type III domain-containing protein [Candidatus Peribacterales bacterium]
MKKNILLATLLFALSFPVSASAVNWEEFDTVAGIPETIRVDGLERWERSSVLYIFECAGRTFERNADVDGGDAEVVLQSKDVEKAGVCHVSVKDGSNEMIAEGSFEIFADVPVQWELIALDNEPFLLDEEVELKAGYFDKFRNPTSGRLIAVSGDGDVMRLDEDTEGYLHLSFTPDTAGTVEIKLIDTLTDENRAFTFNVKDPTPPPPAASAAPAHNADAVTTLLGQLIRASLLTEYGKSGQAETVANPEYGLVDSFEVQVGDSAATILINEQQDLLLTALDRRGRVVENYVDRVTIETSDPDAVTPSGLVRFKASDRGRKILPLTIMFQTPGEQTVTVRDESDPSEIFGMTKVWVMGHTAAPANRSITILEQPGAVMGRTVTISGTAPAYTNLDLYSIDNEGIEAKLATTSSDEEGTFVFTTTLEGAESSYTLFVRDPEDRVKDSDHITITVDSSVPVMRNPILTPASATPGMQVLVSVEAESKHQVNASLPTGAPAILSEKQPGSEEGFSLYEGTLIAPEAPNQYPVTISATDAARNETKITSMLIVSAGTAGLPAVKNFRAEVIDQEIKLAWDPVQGATHYRVYFGSSPLNLEKFIDTNTASTSIRLTGLTPGQMTYFAVTGLADAGEESMEKSDVVSAALRGSMFDLTAQGMVNGVMLQWVAPPGIDIDRYRIRYGIESRSYMEERWVLGSMAQFELRDLINGVPYFLLLSALQKNGQVLDDTVETSVTPGENGMPGISIGISDPLPPGIGGPDGSSLLRDTHDVAPIESIPESGASTIYFLLIAGGIVGMFAGSRAFRAWRLERELLSLMGDSFPS